jgi:hypothetical protein
MDMPAGCLRSQAAENASALRAVAWTIYSTSVGDVGWPDMAADLVIRCAMDRMVRDFEAAARLINKGDEDSLADAYVLIQGRGQTLAYMGLDDEAAQVKAAEDWLYEQGEPLPSNLAETIEALRRVVSQ